MADVATRPGTTVARWTATVFYRADSGVVDVQHDMLEISDLHDLVERGPHWDTIERIEIVRAGKIDPLTIEGAAKL